MGKAGRPKGSDNKEKICSTRLDEETLKRLSTYCEKTNMAKSTVIRKALDMLLEEGEINKV